MEIYMKSDIQIAQEAVMEPIAKVAASIGVSEDDLELYGKYFDKDNNSIGFNIHMHGEKCIGGKGFIEWF